MQYSLVVQHLLTKACLVIDGFHKSFSKIMLIISVTYYSYHINNAPFIQNNFY